MKSKLYEAVFPAEIMARGFWLYAWKIIGPIDSRFCYAGMRGDVTGVAQSPFNRASAHFGSNKNANQIKSHLASHGIEPEESMALCFSIGTTNHLGLKA